MDKSALEHISESIFSHPISKDTVEIRLKTKFGDDIKKVELLYADKFKFHFGVKSKEITEDESKGAQDDIQKLTDKYIAEIEKLLENKEKEIMEV